MSTTRGYLTDTQYQSITGNTALGSDADKIIGRAEAIIDGHLGFWQPAFREHWQGMVTLGEGGTVYLAAGHVASLPGKNYLKGLVLEFLSGDNEGKFFVIKSSELDGTFEVYGTEFTAPAEGDIYHIYQMGKVPRAGESDQTTFVVDGITIYSKTVPQALREAVAYQVAYMVEMGDAFFDGNALNMAGESFGTYSYTKAESGQGAKAIIAPRARQALSGTGLINRTGVILG